MRIATRFGWGAMSMTVFLAAQAYGQQMPSNTPEAQKAAAQLSQPAGPRAQNDTPNQQSDRTTVPGYTLGANSASNSDASNRPQQHIYENSAAVSGRDLSMGGAPADNSRDNRSNQSAASGQQRGEIGVWLVENGGQGVRVGRLARGGAADQAGLRSGDIILQVNGNGVSSPSTAAQQIRAIPVGQAANLTLLRDGGQQQMQITLAAARPGQSYQVGYGAENDNSSDRGMMSSDKGSSGLVARTARLEQQVESMTEELRQMRQQMSSMRTGGAATSGIGAEQPGAGIGTTPSAVSPTPTTSTPPQPGSATSSSSTNPSSSPATGSSSSGSATPSSSKSGGPSSSDTQDLFGTGSSSSGASPAGGATK